jgi:N-methylhydantoinase A
VFSLLAFGGAGPLLATLLAREMAIREVIIPLAPAGFSAWGMLSADVVNDYSRTDLRTLDEVSPDELAALFAAIAEEASSSLASQGVPAAEAILDRQLELRYLGQEHGIAVPVGDPIDLSAVRDAFEEAFQARYGHVMEGSPLQIFNVRVRGIGSPRRPELARLPPGGGDPSRALRSRRDAFCFDRRARLEFAVYDRSLLAPGDRIRGPAIVDEGTSTTILHSDQSLEVDEYGHLLIAVGAGA